MVENKGMDTLHLLPKKNFVRAKACRSKLYTSRTKIESTCIILLFEVSGSL
jgi:hypothetical protein